MKILTKNPIKKLTVILLMFLAVSVYLSMPEAGGAAYAQTAGGFSIRAVIPENQMDVRQTYFDLRMQPSDEQDLQVVITNSRDEELVAEVRLNNASTGRNGLIVYTEPEIRDELMKIAVTDVASIQAQQVTVPARSSKTVTIRVKMPEVSFDGVILGGIAVTGNDNDGDTVQEQGVSIRNTITYVIALKITENGNEAPADFDLTAITPSLVNYKTSVVATLANKSARIVKNMEVNAQIYRKGSDTVLRELSLTESEMAPLSKGDFVIDWDDRTLDRGTYRLRMTADYEGRRWEWDTDFTIDGNADDLNKGAVGIKKNYTWLYVLLGLALLALVWIIAYRSGRRKKDEDKDGDIQPPEM